MTEKPKPLFGNLGKATLRGIRKCPKCGIYNGTRGLACKNKECGLIFKVPKEKVQANTEVDAVKLICSSNIQIYSVRQKDANEVHRCFVHLPIIEGIEALQDDAEVKVIKQSAAMCYASSCRKFVVQLSTITLNFNPCHHTSSVVTCQLEAAPLVIKKMVVKLLPIPEGIKEMCLQLAASDEHVVQRISKTTMVVKCEDFNHPLGFLHFCIYEPSKKSKRYKILCECHTEQTKPYIPHEKKMCLHCYICICAIASDQKLLNEFNSFMQQVLKFEEAAAASDSIEITGLELDSDMTNCDMIEVSSKKAKTDESLSLGIISDEAFTIKSFKAPKKNLIHKAKLDGNQLKLLPSLHFEDWLASVTERINQTMHYQFDGSPKPLTFQVPEAFFDILQSRITTGSKKKRLPNSLVAISRKDSPPLGVFSKYRYEITNILHVKRIFDTTKVPLEITRSFMENKDGTFAPYESEQPESGNILGNSQKSGNLLIKPSELKTFLKVGIMSVGQKEPTPFVIEWVPDILPKTHAGEMTITFQYGHQKNGMIEKRNQLLTSTENSPETELYQ